MTRYRSRTFTGLDYTVWHIVCYCTLNGRPLENCVWFRLQRPHRKSMPNELCATAAEGGSSSSDSFCGLSGSGAATPLRSSHRRSRVCMRKKGAYYNESMRRQLKTRLEGKVIDAGPGRRKRENGLERHCCRRGRSSCGRTGSASGQSRARPPPPLRTCVPHMCVRIAAAAPVCEENICATCFDGSRPE